MKKLTIYITCFLLAWLFISCRTHMPYVLVESKTDSIYIDKLIPYPMPADSASIRAFMDDDGKPILTSANGADGIVIIKGLRY